ncbi:hypothetical protein B5S28_g758 [[Candida] boidinii]|nr:hypothetical protein B5S28_g758 [[Candida] boidinii]
MNDLGLNELGSLDAIAYEGIQFIAKTSNIIPIYHLISSLLPFGKNCTIIISKDGLCLTITDNNTCKILLNLDKRLFNFHYILNLKKNNKKSKGQEDEDDDDDDDDDEYGANVRFSRRNTTDVTEADNNIQLRNENDDDEIEDDDSDEKTISLNIDLKSLIETINIHIPSEKNQEPNVNCILSYRGEGYPFVLTFEDSYVIERCELLTLHIDSDEDYSVLTKRNANKNKHNHKVHQKKNSNNNNTQNGEGNSQFDEFFNEISNNYEDTEVNVNNYIFQLDTTKIMYEIVLKSSLLFDAIKDMNDLNTEEFILFCSKELSKSNNKHNSPDMNDNSDGESIRKRLVLISKSSDDSIGYSKLIIPEKRAFLKDISIYRPELITFEDQDTDLEDDSSDNGEDGDLTNLTEDGNQMAAIRNEKKTRARERIEKLNNSEEKNIEMIPAYTSISSFYNFHYFSKILKSIKLSKLIKIRKDLNGITSLSLLITSAGSLHEPTSSRHNNNNNNDDKGLYFGTSIEFITLETIPIEERYFITNSIGEINNKDKNESENNNSGTVKNEISNSTLLKYGYNNTTIEQMITDDDNINVIVIGNNGQLTTLDDFFTRTDEDNFINSHGRNSHKETNHVDDLHRKTVPISTSRRDDESRSPEVRGDFGGFDANGPISNQLESLILGTNANTKPSASNNKIDDGGRIEVDETVGDNSDDDNHNEKDTDGRRKNNKKTKRKPPRKGFSRNYKRKDKDDGSDDEDRGQGKKRNKGKGEAIQTVGGAIEIPLYI